MEKIFKKLVLIKILFFIICLKYFVKSENILALIAVGSPSHYLWNSVILHKLAERGHNVTIFSADLPKNKKKVPKNAHYIHAEKVYNTMYESSNSSESLDLNDFIGTWPHEDIKVFYEFCESNNKGVLLSNGFKQLLNYPDDFKFDLIIFDYTLGGPEIGFLHKFKYPPLIGISAFHLPLNTFDYLSGHFYPAYVPFYSLACDTNMNFLQRLYNTFLIIYDAIYRRNIFNPKMNDIMKEYFSNNIPYIGDIQKKMILALVNSHPSINYPQPIPPNIIEIGGVQLQDAEPLDKGLEEFINNSKKGAILFSFGTNMKPEDVGPQKAEIFLKVMEQFPDYHFLWKFDLKYINRKIPSNVMVRDFYPQKDVLAHPKLKLFISHAGGLSTQEAIWRGVPMLGVPLFADQHRNLHKSILAGVATKIDYLRITVNNLKDAINEMLTNKTYSEKVKIKSKHFQDRPIKALDIAVWWIEYVLRNSNFEFLQSPTLKLGFIVGNSLDVLVFIIIMFIVTFVIIYKILQNSINFLRIQKKPRIKSSKKHN